MRSGLAAAHGQALLAVLGLAAAVALARLVRGPSLADRVIALDLIAMIGAAICCAAAIAYGRPWPLDAALVLASVGFVGTAAFAHHIARDRGGR